MATETSSKRGIPLMDVIEDVGEWLKKEKMDVEEAVKAMDERYKKYKYVESTMQQQKSRVVEKVPEYTNSLAILEVLIEKRTKGESFETTYLLAEDVYTKALVPKPEKVAVWLGANVMVEFELEKARDLLKKNKDTVEQQISELTDELSYVKDQITTTEVNIAHIYNFGVKLRQQASASA